MVKQSDGSRYPKRPIDARILKAEKETSKPSVPGSHKVDKAADKILQKQQHPGK